METKHVVKVLASTFKISLAILIAMVSCKVYAEYYLVKGSPCGYHRYYCKTHHTCHHKKHHRYYSPYGVSITAVCPCSSKIWIRGHRNCCGHYVRGHFVTAAGVYYAQPAYYQDYGYTADYGYDPDLATGDDNQAVYPDMDIDE